MGTARGHRVPPGGLGALRPGDQVWMDDGMIQLGSKRPDGAVRCRVTAGGACPTTRASRCRASRCRSAWLTEKDREDLRFGIAQGVDYVAVSFVRSAADIEEVRRFLRGQGADVPIIAKLERAEI